ncbi:MBOAT family protein [Ancylostoma caninum]|uniref:Lysophospholipid acyltransferase 5 n=1 Tax=Ancylostoma caninum TaxID=29170 RepID=A0A368GZJ2_ANCCA|nr:MBOAT family protein [Ancylostoma caninum]
MVVHVLASLLNAREDGLRLFLCVLAGYPLAIFHRNVLHTKPAHIQHMFFVVTGVILHIFNCGYDVVHTLIAIVFAYLITNFLRGKVESILAAHTAFLGYLLVAYWFEESDGYDINWTTPFCVLVLRFIGLVMEVYDGAHMDKLKPDQKETAIKDVPGLLEIAAFGLFYTGTFAGPQFSLNKFRSVVNGDWLDEKRQPRASAYDASLRRFVGGCIYMAINQIGCAWLTNSYFNTSEFYQQSFFWRCTWATIWFRLVMYRYCAMWMVVEGASILNGLGYNGKDKKGEDRWDGARDIHVWKWETGHDFTSLVQSFNCGTNTWAKNHILRRLRWLNNKPAAHLATLIYLAVWHGYHLGYFLIFTLEFGCMVAQEQLYSLIDRTPGWAELVANPSLRPFVLVSGRIIVLYTTGVGFLTFGLVKTKYWIGPVKSLYFFVYIVYFIIWPLLYQFLRKTLPRTPKPEKQTGSEMDSDIAKKVS